MSDKKSVRLNKLVKEFNVSIDRIYSFLEAKGIEDLKPNTKVSNDIYMDLLGEFDSEKKAKLSAELLSKENELAKAEEIIKQQEAEEKAQKEAEEKKKVELELKVKKEAAVAEQEKEAEEKVKVPAKDEIIKAKTTKKELKILGKVDIEPKKPVKPKPETPKVVVDAPKQVEKIEEPKKVEGIIKATAGKLRGVKVTGQTIDLNQFKNQKKLRKRKE